MNKKYIDIECIKVDQEGEKIIAIPFKDPNYNQYTDIEQIPTHVFDEMRHFFTVYKNLENKETVVNEVSGRETALTVIAEAIDRYVENFCK